eukprot:gnl/MRDRNA2_/MRDRNA2_86492_c0_seq25.p1 gnl/MRDRNA2_/MRDRNA2_86492_c0~~gnl/MRDRNA2_/MRDRNA2_86492_c0_seq25.p1  ORF type:complete len:578 (+),score=114.41 gnl/MRDRNA2_/MRDRNA2_86492_c0_seq25:83-1735(+)
MMASCKFAFVFLAGFFVTVKGRDFLGAKRKVNTEHVQAELQGVLAEVLGHGHGVADGRFDKIRTVATPMFKTLPKNGRGHLSADVMRYAVRRYFRQSHGWIVKGFEVHAETVITNTSNADILQSKLPAFIRTMMEKQFAHDGFSLDALIVMIAALERLAFDEVVRGVESSFFLNSYALTNQSLTSDDLTEILSSFLITEMLEGADNIERHMVDKKYIYDRYPFWGTTVLFLIDTIMSDIWRENTSFGNPFQERKYSFEDVVRMAEAITEQFGSWSNYECHEMKDMLMEMDVHGTGRVKLSEFYGYSKDGAWQFLEPSEQLRQGGALDESSTWLGPQVMIPNYINAMSNCITSQPYYQICCLNECDHVFQQLETHIAAPSATVSEVIKALESGVYAPTSISDLQRERLDEIALVHNGKIPIYGRLFARWLHFVYPHECPYPHAEGVVKPMTQREWKELVGVKAESATDDEIAQHLGSDYARRAPSADAGATMWSLEESLLDQSEKAGFSIWALLRIAVQISMLAGFVSLIRPLMQMLRSDVQGQKAVQYDV